MTEQEFRSLPKFAELPLYEYDDPRCEQVDRSSASPDHLHVTEATEYEDAVLYSSDDTLEPRGGIRFDLIGSPIYAYFWKKRPKE